MLISGNKAVSPPVQGAGYDSVVIRIVRDDRNGSCRIDDFGQRFDLLNDNPGRIP